MEKISLIDQLIKKRASENKEEVDEASLV